MSNHFVADLLLHYWKVGRATKSTPSGWISANAVCCSHRGESADKKMRGGIFADSNGGVSYSCFNCGFKTAWQPGWNLSYNMRLLLQWLGVPDSEINKLSLDILRLNNGVESKEHILLKPDFNLVKLPEDARPLADCDQTDHQAQTIIEYAKNRNFKLTDYNFYWSPHPKFKNRLIIPFYYQNKIVGWTARSIDNTSSVKYISDQQPGYVFNIDNQTYNKAFCILVEGPLDAIHIDGAALCGSSINDQQAYILNSLNKPIIVLPDRDKAGSKLVDQAIERGWSVSFPNWKINIKDTSDAVRAYGKLYTLYTIVSYTQSTEFKIKLAEKFWFNNNKI